MKQKLQGLRLCDFSEYSMKMRINYRFADRKLALFLTRKKLLKTGLFQHSGESPYTVFFSFPFRPEKHDGGQCFEHEWSD